MLCIGVRKYGAQPSDRRALSAWVLRNAVRLAMSAMPRSEVGKVLIETLEETANREERAA
jgi:hypothetical protein